MNPKNKHYAIGQFSYKKDISSAEEVKLIKVIGDFPTILRKQVEVMTKADSAKNWLYYRYREGG